MKKQTIFHLMRHGETDYNLQRIWQGSLDISLNATGKSQAKEAAKQWIHRPIHALYCSHLKRAMETASIIGKEKNMVPIPFKELAEQNFGSLEGKEIQPEMFQEFRNLSFKKQLHYKFIEDMESSYECLERVLPGLKKIASDHPDEEVLIVSHGSVILSILKLLQSHHAYSPIENCAWFTFEYHHEESTLRLLEEIKK